MAKKDSGKSKRAVSGLPDVLSPLNVKRQTGDVLVPENDMEGVGGAFSKGTSVPDPLDIVPAKGK